MPDGPLVEGSIFADDYRVGRLLHAGGLSTLYQVEQISTGVGRALKVVHGALGKDARVRELFLAEAKKVGQIESDHVDQVLACAIDSSTDLPYAVLELIEGETLVALVERGPVAQRDALDLLTQLAHPLVAAHDKGIVHRDLKPEGVMLAAGHRAAAAPTSALALAPRVKLLFLGVAKVASEAKHNTTAAMARPHFMAPEQTEAERAVSPATDVWAFGLLAYYVLTGKHYWKTGGDMGSAMMSLMREVVFEDIVLASVRAREQGVADKLPPGFDAWFARAVDRDPARRFDHMRPAIDELRTCLAPATSFPGAASTHIALPKITPPPPPATQGGGPGYSGYPPLPPLTPPPRKLNPSRPPSAGGIPVWLIAGGIAALVVLLVGAAGGAIYFVKRAADQKAAAARAEREKDDSDDDRSKDKRITFSDEACPVPVSSDDPMWGDRAAPVTIVEFSDFQCPFCKRATATLTELKESYGPSKLRIIWKNNPLPFHNQAKPAALAAMTLFDLQDSKGFWRFHDLAFANQSSLDSDAFEKWASESGSGRLGYMARKDAPSISAKVEKDIALAKTLGVKGTPHFFINGKSLSGAQPKSKFAEVIDVALAEAILEKEKGTPADKIYVTLTSKNFKKDSDSDAPVASDNTLYRVPVGSSPVRGPATALVTIVEFGDYQCPFTARAESTMSDLRSRYGDKLRLVWKDTPLKSHVHAASAANFAREVRTRKGDDAFWKAHDLLFANQRGLEDSDLQSYATQLGLDGSVLSAVHSEKYKQGISDDQAAADAVGGTGTPLFYVNGRKVSGAVPIDTFVRIIDEEIPKAQAIVARGVPAEAVYDEILKDAKGADDFQTKEPGPIPLGAPSRGSATATIVIQEWSDLECPYCKKVEATLDDVLRDNSGKVRIVWRHFPISSHKTSHLAAEIAEEVRVEKGDLGFFRFKSAVFELPDDTLDRDKLVALALAQGIDRTKLDKAIDAHTHAARVDADADQAKHLGLTGAPSFLVGRYLVVGAQPAAKFQRAIDKALADARH